MIDTLTLKIQAQRAFVIVRLLVTRVESVPASWIYEQVTLQRLH